MLHIVKLLQYIYIFFFVFILSAHAKGIYNEETFTLSNGLQVIVISDHRAPIIYQGIGYKVGSIEEDIGLTGQAHLLEHLMFKGTKNKSGKEFDSFINSVGGQQNGYTNLTATAYYQITPSSEIETLMKWEASRMRGVVFTKEILDTERKVVLQEKRQRLDSSPVAKFFDATTKDMFKGTLKDRSVIGSTEDLNAISVGSLKLFYDTYYHPNNAYVVLSGDITLERAKVLAKKHYGQLKSQPIPKKKIEIKSNTLQYVRKTYTDKRYNNRLSMRSYFTNFNLYDQENIKALQALRVVLFMLFQSDTSPAQKELIENGIFTDINIDTNASAVGFEYNIITMRSDNKKNKESEEVIITDWLNKSKRHLTQKSLFLAQQNILKSVKISTDDSLGNAENMLNNLGNLRTGDLKNIAKNARLIDTLTLQDIIRAYNTYLLKAPYFHALLKGSK